MNLGWIKLHRKLWDNPRSTDPDWLAVWIYLLSHATHQDFEGIFEGKQITLKPGQLITGRRAIAERTGVNESKVKRILKRLKIDNQIAQLPGSRNSLITVINWAYYQNSDQQNGQLVPSYRPATDQPLTTNKNRRIEEQKKTRENPGAPLPIPQEIQAWNSHSELPSVRSVSAKRIKNLQARRADPFFAEHWEQAIARISASSFCRGGNDRNWKANFDWFLFPDTVLKVIEGQYDNNEPKAPLRNCI